MLENQIELSYGSDVAARRKKASWGGRRPGAGRQPVLEDAVHVSFDLEARDFRVLRAFAEEKGISVAEVLRTAVRGHLKRRRRG